MSAKKKSAGKGTKRAKPAKVKAKASAPKKKAAKKGAAKAAPKKAAPKKVAPKKKVAAKKAAPKKGAKKAAPKKVAAKRAAPKKVAAKRAAPRKKAAPEIKRRDGAGHLDPKYAADLRARIEEEREEKDDDRAFLAGSRTGESLSEELGEEFVETVTSGEDEGAEVRDQNVTEELGGPFTVTSGGTEFADGVDESNPESATKEPFPRT